MLSLKNPVFRCPEFRFNLQSEGEDEIATDKENIVNKKVNDNSPKKKQSTLPKTGTEKKTKGKVVQNEMKKTEEKDIQNEQKERKQSKKGTSVQKEMPLDQNKEVVVQKETKEKVTKKVEKVKSAKSDNYQTENSEQKDTEQTDKIMKNIEETETKNTPEKEKKKENISAQAEKEKEVNKE